MGKQCQILFFGAPKSLQMVIAAMKLKDAYSNDCCEIIKATKSLASLVGQLVKSLPAMQETCV